MNNITNILDKFNTFLKERKRNIYGDTKFGTSGSEIRCTDWYYSNENNIVHTFGDSFWPTNIVICKPCDISKLLNLSVKYGNGTIFCIPINLLIQLSGLYSDKNYYYIKIIPELFFRDENKYINSLGRYNFYITLESTYSIKFLYM